MSPRYLAPPKEIAAAPSYASARACSSSSATPVTPRILPPFVTRRSPWRAVPLWKTSAPQPLGLLDAVDRRPRVVPLRIVPGGDHDGRRRARRGLQVDLRQVACRRPGECAEQVAVEAREERLCLRVAEPAVELEHLRAVRGQHQPREEDARERSAAPRELLEHWRVDPVDELGDLVDAEARHGRERSHAARVRAGVAVADALVVARGCERDGARAVTRARRRRAPPPRAVPRRRRRRRAQPQRRAPRPPPSCVRQTKTPLPAASPSALTTHGAAASSSICAVGTPAASSTSFAKLFEPSILAAAALGPNTGMPPWRSRSATPATSGASGPITARSISSDCASSSRASPSSARTGWQVPSAAIPGLPGAACSSAKRSLCASFHARACSLPPEPTISTRTRRV